MLIIVLFTITVPLRNYFQGRSEITRLNETIASQQLEKERLLGEIEQYEDDSYLQEQARNRLGLIEPGETAFRIIDPRMDQNDTATTSQEELAAQRTWFEILWDSVATVPTVDSEDILVEE
ncbi:hypothetical protein C5L39_08610 [Corynebacterium alimapuense]|uniref:Septum formation initiator n=1 Tax=Corynebacterium alimapuense TaxID=1576874 RepID=A0A3M8K651_9CORY|nr:hypothetical protein C5L39_08610 [Corynebacterium alimapuense]